MASAYVRTHLEPPVGTGQPGAGERRGFLRESALV